MSRASREVGRESIPEALQWLRKRFDAEAARAVHLGCRMELSGEGGGTLWIRIDDGRLDVGEGAPVGTVANQPDVVFELAAPDLLAVLAGSANPDLLYAAGRLTIRGDLSLALKLRRLFGRAA